MSMRVRSLLPILIVVVHIAGAYQTAAPRPVPVHVDQHLGGTHPDGQATHPARDDTLWFGGDDGSGRPYEGGVWDFDTISGDPMQGWRSIDMTCNRATYFCHVTEDSFLLHGDTCVPIVAENAGMIWCGVHMDEALLRDFLGGMGYQNKLCQRALSPIFPIDPAIDDIDLGFAYFNFTEWGYDYTYIYVSGFDAGGELIDELELADFDGVHGDPLNLAEFGGAGPEVPAGALDPLTAHVQVEFRVTSDWVWSDEDGLWDTPCGPFGVDDVAIAIGSRAYGYDYDDGPQGWEFSKCNGVGDFTSLIDEAMWEPWIDEAGVLCQCGLGGNALGFVDVEGSPFYPPGMHLRQRQLAHSPAMGRDALPGEDWNAAVAQFDAYLSLHMYECVYYRVGYMYYPYASVVNPEAHWSPRLGGEHWYSTSGPSCDRLTYDFAHLASSGEPLPSDWDSVRVVFEVWCDYFGSCYDLGETSGSPLLDNVRLGVYQDSEVPRISLIEGGEFQDGFGQGFPTYLEPSDRGDANVTCDLGAGGINSNSRLADSSAIVGPTVLGNAPSWLPEIRFRVTRKGARQDLIPEYHAWKDRLSGDPEAGFVAVMMDSCMTGLAAWTERFCTYIHEGDPAFNHAYPHQCEANEILPDGVLVPGTSIEYYVASWWFNDGAPPEEYFTSPMREFEILPSMTLVSGEEFEVQWPSVLYIDAYNHGGEHFIEAMLTAAGVSFDKYDYLHATSNFNAPIKRSYGGTGFNPGGYGNNGCTLEQLLGYRLILVSTGSYGAPCMEPEDFELFSEWLGSTACGGGDRRRGIIFNGDQIARILADPYLGQAPAFANNVLGVTYEAESYRTYNDDEADCVYLEPHGASAFEPTAPGVALFGNECPQLFDFNVLGTQTGVPGVIGNLRYFSYGATGLQSHVDYAQVVREHTEPGVANWRSVVDGFSLHHLTPQHPDCPNDSASIVTAGLALLMPQLEWMSDPEDPFIPWRYLCGALGADPGNPAHLAGPVDHLYAARPNPFTRSAAIRFSLAQLSRVEVTIYDPTGRRIRTLLDTALDAGEHCCTWEGVGDAGQRCGAGIYWVQMRTAGGYASSRRMLRLD